jgi:hypothetical protein
MTEGLQEEIYGPINAKQRQSLQTVERSGTHLLHWCQLKPKALLNKDRRMDYAMLTHHQSTINQAL